jgi:gliding motility-associated-like protein
MRNSFKILFFYFLITFSLFTFNIQDLNAQVINLVRFNNVNNYYPGSGVSVIINPTGIFAESNQFKLELSDVGGVFNANTRQLSSLSEFYVPVMNGTLPTNITPGLYKLRISSTAPVLNRETNAFNVVPGSSIGVPTFSSNITNNGTSTFNCLTSDCTIQPNNNIFGQIDAASGDTTSIIGVFDLGNTICNNNNNNISDYSVNLINISDQSVTSLTIYSPGVFYIPSDLQIGTYVIEITKNISGVVSLFSNTFIFHGNATNINNLNSETVCVGNLVNFSIDITPSGIGRNYMGSLYTINYGDGTPVERFTHAQLLSIISTNGFISHTYNSVSCSVGSGVDRGYFILKLRLWNKGVYNQGLNNNYCNTYYENGNGVDKRVNTNRAPVAQFTLNQRQCINTAITATNTTILGQYGAANCLTAPRYVWYVKSPNDTNFIPVGPSYNPTWISGNNLIIPASDVSISGCWEIKLEARNSGAGCTSSTIDSKTIRIQAVPVPSFTNNPTSPICAGQIIQFTNTSNILSLQCQDPTYSWTVTPVTGTPATVSGYQYANSTSASSQNPQILFTQPGSYDIVMNVINSCGTFPTTTRRILVNGDPTVNFTPNTLSICNVAPPSYTIDFSQTGTKPIYSAAPYAPTSFVWTVTGPGVIASDYNFTGSTTNDSQFPKINFTSYKTYTITVSVNGSCAGSNQAVFTFTYKQTPVINNSNLAQTICSGSTMSSVVLTSDMGSGTTYGWNVSSVPTSAITGFTTPGVGSTIPSIVLNNSTNASGVANFSITPTNNGCNGTPVQLVINVNALPSITGTLNVCIGSTRQLTGSATAATTNAWVSSDTSVATVDNSGLVTGVGIGTTSITYTNSNGCQRVVLFTVNALPTITGVLTICAGSTSQLTGSATAGSTNAWVSSNTSVATVNNSGLVTGVGAGTTTITYTNSNGCQITASIIVNALPTISGTLSVCAGSTIQLTGSATAAITNAWVSSNTTVATIDNTGLVSGLTAGTTSITYTNSNGCQRVVLFTVNSVQTINGILNVCVGATRQLTGTGTPSAINPWVSSNTLVASVSNTGLVSGIASGNSTITYTNSSGCQNTANIVVNALPTITGTLTICAGSTTQLTGSATAVTSNAWVSSNTSVATISNTGLVTGVGAGTTTITYTNSNGCQITANVFVNALSSITGTLNVCIGSTRQLTGSATAATTNAWVSSDTSVATVDNSGLVTGVGIGTTSITYTNSNGCQRVVLFTVNALPTITGVLTICAGSTSQLTGSATAGSTNAWVSSNTSVATVNNSGLVTGVGAGTTTITYTNSNGCQITASIIVNALPTISGTLSVCAGSTIQLTGSATAAITNAWVSSNTTVATIDNTGLVSGLTAGTTSITYTNSNGCQRVVSITVNPLPTISGTLNVCIGSNTQLSGSVTAATSNPWGSSDTSIATVSNSGLVTGISPGTVTITYTNSNGCQKTESITVNPLPTISGTLFVCKGSTTQLTGSGTPAVTGAWLSSVPTIATINSTSGLVTAVNTGTTLITYTNSNGCKINATITVNPLGQVNTTANQSLCDGGMVNVSFTTNNVPGTTVYDWTSTQTPNVGLPAIGSGNISFTASNIGSGIATSSVVVTPTYTNGGVGCPGPTSQFTISVYPPPTISVHPTPTQDICVGGTVPAFNVAYINGYGNPDYQWFYNTSPITTGATIISGAINPTYTPPSFLATGTYYYFARVCLNGLGCGCVFSNIAQVNVYGDPNATITPSTQTICQNTPPTPIVVTASAGIPSGVYTYQWYSNVAPNTIGGIPLVPAVTTSTFIPPTNTVQTNYYYCIISNGLNCNYTTPVVQVVTVAAPIAHLQPTPTQTLCLNGTPTTLTVDFINGTGTPTYQWYSNTVNALTGTAIAGATSLSYVPPTSATGTLYYYCIATYNSGGCTTATSNIAQVIVNPIQTITTQPLASQDICSGGAIAPLTVAYTDGVGTATYQWYSNTTNANTGGSSISGANASTYTPPVFNTTGDYYYYAMVSLSGSGCGSVASATALVHVVADPTVTITPSTQTICQGTTPTNLVVTPSGGVGTYSYQWYSNTTNNTTTGTSLGASATSATYTPLTTVLGTRYYYCIITQTGLGCGVTSAAVSVQVVAAPSVSTQPTPTQTVCLNGASTALSITLNNGTGTPTYQWYSNTVNALTGTAIVGATSLSYVPPTSATGTLYYYCIATYNSGGCTTATSNIAQVIVNPIQTITTQPLASQDICSGGAIAPLTVAYTDGVGTATYQWYSNTTNANTGGSSISGANASTYTPPVFNTTGDYYYYAMVSLSGSGCGSVASATALVHVVADPTVTITPSTQTICQGTTPTNLVVTPSGGVGTYSYQWYSNTTNNTTTGTLISGANSSTYTPPNSIVGIKYYYCMITQSGLGCSVTSVSSQLIIVSVPTISNQPLATQTICQNDPSTQLSVTVINGTGIPTYQWYSNTTNSIVGGTAITGATNATYSPSTIINNTKYYYCIIQYSAGGCGSLTTNISTVIVNSIAFIPNKAVTICSGASFNISPTGSVLPEIVPIGTQYTWFVNPTPNSNVSGYSDMLTVPQSNITQTLTNNGAIPYNVVYNVTPITGNCQGLPFTITVTVNPKVKPNVTINNIICNSNPPFCNGSILLAPTGATPFSYQWSIPGTTSTQTNLCSGNYWVDITDTYSCTYRFNYTVTVPPPMVSVPAVNPINNTNCDVATGCNGIIQVAVSGGTPFTSTTNPYQYQWFQVTSSGNVPISTSLSQGNISILQNICGGTYYLVVTDSVNCQKQFGPYTITDPAPLVITSTLSNYNGFQVSCNGGSNGSIGINVTGSNGPINVILNPLGPNTIILPNPANFTGLPAGNYTVVIRDLVSNCPDIIRNIVLTSPPTLQANVTQTVAILCNGNFATYQAVVTGGVPYTSGSQYQYLWTPSNEITSSATNLPAGAYNVLVTDANGCTFNGSGVITQPSLLVATANITTPIRCFGGTATVTVTATGGVPNTTSGSPVYSGTGVFTVSAGVNVFTVTDFNGCQKSITINVPEPPLLQVTAVVTTPISCYGGNATVTVSAIGGVQNYTGTGNFSVSAGNNIPFTVTDANGCSKTVFLNITQPTLLVASATVTSPILCNGGTGIITISGTGGTPFATGPLYSGTGPITVSASSGTYTISDANGCSASVPFTITQPTPVVATATIISPILCKGGTAIVSVGATGGVPGGGYVGTGNFTVYAGTHTYFVRDSNGCISNTVTIVVTEPPLLVASSAVTSPVLCNGGTAVVTVTATGGTPLYTINAGDYGNYTVTAGLHLYTVIDANGCRSSTSITVTQPGPLAFTIKSATNPNCFPNRLYNNGSICISITGGTNPFPVGPGWVRSTNILTPNDWCLNGLSAGTYTIAIADVNNCPANTRTVTLTRPTPITGFITSNLNVNCSIKNVSQTNYIFASGGVPGYIYNWSGGVPCAGPPNPLCMTTDVNGNYFVDVNDQEGVVLGCIPVQFPVVVNLPVIGNPLMNISSSAMTICGIYSINDPISFTNVSTGNFTSIEWFVDGVSLAGANSVSHTFTTIGDHNITLVVNYTIGGVTCTYSITQTIAVTKGYDMIVPNAFTPANHDGINDNFKPEYNCMKELEMRVYDTWGSLLYVESGPTLKGWDGTINGHESENGNYIIVVRATTLFGAIVDYNGPFTLIK